MDSMTICLLNLIQIKGLFINGYYASILDYLTCIDCNLSALRMRQGKEHQHTLDKPFLEFFLKTTIKQNTPLVSPSFQCNRGILVYCLTCEQALCFLTLFHLYHFSLEMFQIVILQNTSVLLELDYILLLQKWRRMML